MITNQAINSPGDNPDNMSDCRLTVVVPVYNRAGRVVATLRSLESQTLRPLRIVLVDNNSTDNTLQVLRDWKRRVGAPGFDVTVVEEKQQGAAAARNRGLQEVTTPLTMFFDSDDLMSPEHCRRAVSGFDDNPGTDIVGWECQIENPDGKKKTVVFSDRDVIWDNLFYGSMSTLRYVARTELFRRAGGWNPDCRGWDDVELGLRILLLSPGIVKLKGQPTVRIVHTADSITGDSFSGKTSVWEHALDLMETTVLDLTDADAPEKRRRVSRYINFRRALLAGDYRREGAAADSRRLLRLSLDKEPSLFYRQLNRLATVYRGLGLPGISRLLRPFFR